MPAHLFSKFATLDIPPEPRDHFGSFLVHDAVNMAFDSYSRKFRAKAKRSKGGISLFSQLALLTKYTGGRRPI